MNESNETVSQPSPWEIRDTERLDRPRRRIGIIVSVAYISVAIFYLVVRWDSFLALDPNELGDFLAGVFAPLAFLWLVLGFFQQGDELRQSSNALWLQGQELQNSVEQQRDLVNVTREQLAFERQRIEIEADLVRRQAQPDLIILGGGHSGGSNGGRSMMFELLNRGAKCTDFRFSSQGREIHHRPVFNGNDRFNFVIEVSPDHPLGTREFHASFIDGLGNRGNETLILEAVQIGSVRILRTVS